MFVVFIRVRALRSLAYLCGFDGMFYASDYKGKKETFNSLYFFLPSFSLKPE